MILLFSVSTSRVNSPLVLLLLTLLLAFYSTYVFFITAPTAWIGLFLFFIIIGGVLVLVSYCRSFLPRELRGLSFSYLYSFIGLVWVSLTLFTYNPHSGVCSSTLATLIIYRASYKYIVLCIFIWLYILLVRVLASLSLSQGHIRSIP